MDDYLYLKRSLLGLKDYFDSEVRAGHMHGGDAHFLSACLVLIALHEATGVDLTNDDPKSLFQKAHDEFSQSSEATEQPDVCFAVKGEGFHHTGAVGLKEFDFTPLS